MLKFIKANKTTAERPIYNSLSQALRVNQRVLWVVSGGSNIDLEVKIMSKVSKSASKKLAIILSDERYGEPGHADSNMKQLYESGFDPKLAIVIPTLRPGMNLEETTAIFAKAAQTAFDAADVVVTQLGMGPDGHVAGILPESPASSTSFNWTSCYKADDYSRITLTPFALIHSDKTYVVAYGASKREALEHLQNEELSVEKQPAQLVKSTVEAYIINDQIGEEK